MNFNKPASKRATLGSTVSAIDPNVQLYLAVSATLPNQVTFEHLNQLIESADPMFVAKLAVYARNEMNFRKLPLYMVIKLANSGKLKGNNAISHALYGVIQRADELAEALAIYKFLNNRSSVGKLSKQVKRGVALSFNKFDAYQMGKYQRSKQDITLRDAMFLSHPKPLTDEQASIFKMIADQTLPIPQTLETAKSSAGQTGESKNLAYEDLIKSKKLGYMATLRNLVNFVKDDVSTESINDALGFLTNTNAILNSKQFPFRFFTAYREVMAHYGLPTFNRFLPNSSPNNALNRLPSCSIGQNIVAALNEASRLSMRNIDGIFPRSEKVMSLVDVSESMSGTTISSKSSVKPIELASFYGASLAKYNENCTLAAFGTTSAIVNKSVLQQLSPFEAANYLNNLSNTLGHGTAPESMINDLIARKEEYHKIVIFSDMGFNRMGMANTAVANYLKMFPRSKIIFMNLNGRINEASSVAISQEMPGLYQVSGFTDQTFVALKDMINPEEIIEAINSIDLHI